MIANCVESAASARSGELVGEIHGCSSSEIRPTRSSSILPLERLERAADISPGVRRQSC